MIEVINAKVVLKQFSKDDSFALNVTYEFSGVTPLEAGGLIFGEFTKGAKPNLMFVLSNTL
jgi:hypothetical protein